MPAERVQQVRFSEGEFFHGREVATAAVRLLAITGKPRARGKKPEPAQTENKKKPKSKKGV
jgi:4'-phosphopantetheinyl transferase EntD